MTREITLTRGMVALVDDADFEGLSRYRWTLSDREGGGYARRSGRSSEGESPRGCVYMHRQIMGAKADQQIDHINHDTLDNRRSNLRFCTQSQNRANGRWRTAKSGFRGVYPAGERSRKWGAKIKANKQVVRLGTFALAVDAARAFDRAARKYHGEFAILNFPDEAQS